MDLLVIRHGKAEEKDPGRYPDDDLRPLTPAGEGEFRQAAQGLRRLGVKPNLILTSPLARARRTAEILREVLALEATTLRDAGALRPDAPQDGAWEALGHLRGEACVALVGHEPWLGQFISQALTGQDAFSFPLKKGACCALEFGTFGRGLAALSWSLRPGQLALIAASR